jgi:carbon monoxide dehydrogenase subunit G
MELTNEFRVGVPVSVAWKVLTDVERIAPMLPGAQLQEVDGEEYRGVVKVKVGPITAQYKGTATFIETDEAAGRVVLKATGRDTRGQGNASAVITATMTPNGDGTNVTVVTDLTVTGKVAQFGRGVLADVSGKLIGQFVDALEADLASSEVPTASPGEEPEVPAIEPESPEEPVSDAAQAAATNGSVSSGPRRIDSPEAEPIDLLAVAGESTVMRILPAAGVFLVVLVILFRRRSRRVNRLSRLAAQVVS